MLAELQPGWPVHLLDGVGHVPQIEAPERTAALLLPFLADLSRTRTGDRVIDLTSGPGVLASAS
jgi:hypothetical protein